MQEKDKKAFVILMRTIQSAEMDLNALCTYRCVSEIQEYLLNLKDPAVIQINIKSKDKS